MDGTGGGMAALSGRPAPARAQPPFRLRKVCGLPWDAGGRAAAGRRDGEGAALWPVDGDVARSRGTGRNGGRVLRRVVDEAVQAPRYAHEVHAVLTGVAAAVLGEKRSP